MDLWLSKRQWHEASIEIIWDLTYQSYKVGSWWRKMVTFSGFSQQDEFVVFLVASETVTKDVAICFDIPGITG